jgi:ketosteroid isomerase-like protein
VSAANVESARQGFAAALRGDLQTIGKLLDPEVKWHGGDPSALGSCQNRGEALDFMRRARRRRPLGELVDVIDAGERVVVIMRPVPEEGETSELHANVSTFREGRVVEMVHYPDVEQALAAVRDR